MKAGRSPVVLVTSFWPDVRGTGSEQRCAAWVRDLTRDGDLVLVSTSPPGAASLPARVRLVDISDLVAPPRRWSRLAGELCPPLGVFSARFRVGWPAPINRWAAIEIRRRLGSLEPSGLVTFRLAASGVAQVVGADLPAASRHLDLDDLEGRTRLSVARAALGNRDLLRAARETAAGLQAVGLQHRTARSYDVVSLASQGDCARFGRRRRAVVQHRPNQPGPVSFRAPRRRQGNRIVFVGHLGYPPNEAAVKFLVRTLLPALSEAGVRVTLDIAGRSPSARVQDWAASRPEVTLHANVEDLTGLYESATLAVVPVRHGGGTKVKVLEAISHGVPVIATAHGASGLGLQPGQHYLEATSTAEWTRAVAHCLENQDQAVVRANAAQETLRS